MSRLDNSDYVPVSIPQAIWDLRDCIDSIESSLNNGMRGPSVALKLHEGHLDQAVSNLKESLKNNPQKS